MVPRGARLIWNDPPVWVMGGWPGRTLRVVTDQQTQLALFGACSADDSDLLRAARSRDLATVCSGWAGSFVVARHTGTGLLELLSDAAGGCPLYLVETPGGTVWGSSSLALSSLTRRRVDRLWLTSYLANKLLLPADRSAWADVLPVPPGHRVVLAAGRAATVTAWWSHARRPYGHAVALVRRSLLDGVEARLGASRVSVDLAGMDSTTIAAIAARRGNLLTMTVRPEDREEGGDVDYAREFARRGTTHAWLSMTTDQLPFSRSPDQLPPSDEPAPSSASWTFFSAQLRAARDAGSTCHLTGDGGDNLFLPPPWHLTVLARRGRMVRLWRDAHGWARLRSISPWGIVVAAAQGDIQRVIQPWSAPPTWVLESAITGTAPEADPDALLIHEVRNVARAAHADRQLADELEMDLHNPYFDGLLLDAVASARPWHRYSTRRYKPMLADATGDLLPFRHRRRVTKGTFAGDFHSGLRLNLQRILRLADGHLAGLGLIEPLHLRSAIRRAALGVDAMWASLMPTLDAEMWLEATQHLPEISWTTHSRGRFLSA
ncbi:asparagine synthase (glutamine-hydrolysing) [Jiangella alba]|uniref:asparagine synthase (glutamine-hydrolyzing) n=2 Tax=Jiangella alba TaxID=561176 RepID=A0A1H5PGU2_9ACTN|nr:asparagine synthase (glutamine-hydrolysing) [Jiangella alba]